MSDQHTDKATGHGADRHAGSGFETLAIHAGQHRGRRSPAPSSPPIYQVSTYKQDGVGGLRGGYEYSRSANPTRTALEENLAALEGGRRGLAFASGLAAEDCLLRTLLSARRPRGDPQRRVRRHVPALREGRRALGRGRGRSPTPPTSSAVRAAVTPADEGSSGWRPPPTRCWASPTSPRSPRSPGTAGARLVVDNTFASALPPAAAGPRRGRRRALHRRSTWAATPTSSAARWSPPTRALGEELAYHQNAMGAVAGPFDSWLVLRGVKTLVGAHGPAQRERHPGRRHARPRHPKVTQVLLPGPARAPRPRGRRQADARPSAAWSPSASRAARQAAVEVCDRARLFTLGESLGGVESLIEHPGRMTHASAAGSALEVPGRPGPPVGGHRGRRRPAGRPDPGAGIAVDRPRW